MFEACFHMNVPQTQTLPDLWDSLVSHIPQQFLRVYHKRDAGQDLVQTGVN